MSKEVGGTVNSTVLLWWAKIKLDGPFNDLLPSKEIMEDKKELREKKSSVNQILCKLKKTIDMGKGNRNIYQITVKGRTSKSSTTNRTFNRFQRGEYIMEFCKQFNVATQDKQGKNITVCNYGIWTNRSHFDQTPPASIVEYSKVKVKFQAPNRNKV